MDQRRKIIECSYRSGACHIGSALSCVEILNVIGKKKYFIFSKASGVAAYYCLRFPLKKAIRLLKEHPLPSKEAGLLWSGGSLGQGLSVACGLALTGKEVYVLMSDGEFQEGQVWEALMFASHHNLPIKIVIDRNGLQALGSTEEICKLDSLADKLWSFGWNVVEVDGHDEGAIRSALDEYYSVAVIANTVKGKGVDFMENNYKWHYKNLNEEGYKKAIFQLDSRKGTKR